MSDLSRYPHFGKFEGGLNIDSYAHFLSGDGVDSECGDVSAGGWYGLLQGPLFDPSVPDNVKLADECELTAADRDYLATSAGCILTEDSQGFVSVEWFDAGKESDLDSAWSQIEESESDSESDPDDSDY